MIDTLRDNQHASNNCLTAYEKRILQEETYNLKLQRALLIHKLSTNPKWNHNEVNCADRSQSPVRVNAAATNEKPASIQQQMRNQAARMWSIQRYGPSIVQQVTSSRTVTKPLQEPVKTSTTRTGSD